MSWRLVVKRRRGLRRRNASDSFRNVQLKPSTGNKPQDDTGGATDHQRAELEAAHGTGNNAEPHEHARAHAPSEEAKLAPTQKRTCHASRQGSDRRGMQGQTIAAAVADPPENQTSDHRQ